MPSIAFVFSGQGSQYSGMGKELYDNFLECREVFEKANESLGFDLTKICFDENEADKLATTEFAQPAILTLSIACSKLLDKNNIKPNVLAGLSLGEYSALTYANAFKFEEAVKLVNKRGKFMEEAVPNGVGTMSAVLGLTSQELEGICKECATTGYVSCANYNAPGQIVISGEVKAVEAAEKLAIARGAKKVVRLKVSGPFHSEMLVPARELLSIELDKMTINNFDYTIITNINAKKINDKDEIKNILLKQIVSPVYWEQSVRNMIDMGVDTFIELGSGKTLLSFIKQVDRKVKLLNIEDLKSYEKTMKSLEI